MSAPGDQIYQSDNVIFQPVRRLLHSWSLEQYLCTRPPCAVLTLPATATCAQALRLLAKHKISSAPVFDGKTYLGFLDVGDILQALLSLVNVRELSEENKEYKLRAAGLHLEYQPVRSLNLAQDGALIYRADMQSTLHEIVLYGFLQPNAAGNVHVVHRVGVFDTTDDVSDDDTRISTAGPSNININHVVSQSDVMLFLHKHIAELGPLADATLQQLGLASKSVVCVPAEMATIKAFATMVANRVSCVGVITHSQGAGLAASLSSSDLCNLLPEQFAGALSMPVLQYLQAKASAGWSLQQQSWQQEQQLLHQQVMDCSAQQQQQQQQQPQQQRQEHAMGGAQYWGLKSGEGQRAPQLVPVHPGSTVREVLSLLAAHRLHRLHVIDGRNKPVGVVTITDLLRVIVGCNELLQAFGPDLDALEQEVEQMCVPAAADCDCGMADGDELIEGQQGMMAVNSQALLSI